MARLAKFPLLSLLALVTTTYASAVGGRALDGHSAERVLFNLHVSKDKPLLIADTLTPPYTLEIRAQSKKPWAINWDDYQLSVQWHHTAKGTEYDHLSILASYHDAHSKAIEKLIPCDVTQNDLPITLWVKVDTILSISAGYDTLSDAITLSGNLPATKGPISLTSAGSTEIKELRITQLPDYQGIVATNLTQNDVLDRLASTTDPMERLWVYFDRENDPDRVRLGGKYTLATLANDHGGYDIIYMDGAEVQGDKWQAGMLKGQLTPTVFAGRYNLMWIDAVMQPMDNKWEGQAEVNLPTGVLTLNFPLIGAQLRFNTIDTQ